MNYLSIYYKPKNHCKELWTIVKNELKEEENIFITTTKRLDDLKNKEWWKLDEYTFDQIFNVYSGKEKVLRFWHEEGLCIILR